MEMTPIVPYLNFNGCTREAMTFYQSCLGGELEMRVVEGSPMEAHCPPAMKQHIFHAALNHNGRQINASDMIGPRGLHAGNNFSLMIDCATEEEMRTLFDRLSDGGSVDHPIGEMFWGALFGSLVDKFGIQWMLHHTLNSQNP